MSKSFAIRYCRMSVKAARSFNKLSIRLRAAGTPEDIAQAEIFREIARVNIAEAKSRKASARMAGEWV